jgi:hypothetical protein
VLARPPRHGHLEDAHGVAALGDRHDQLVAIVTLGLQVGLLAAEHLLVDRARQRDHRRVSAPSWSLRAALLPRPPKRVDGPPAEVHDQEAELVGVEHDGQLVGHHVDRLDG